MVFSRQNYAYLGNTIASHGQTVWAAALVKFAVVNHAPHYTPSVPPAKSIPKTTKGT